tara:strand:+ start:311 stop:562 length:252 start_codon:yes stop_codon:yes gene_type:complete
MTLNSPLYIPSLVGSYLFTFFESNKQSNIDDIINKEYIEIIIYASELSSENMHIIVGINISLARTNKTDAIIEFLVNPLNRLI